MIEYTLDYIDSCIVDYLVDHHNRDGEILIGVDDEVDRSCLDHDDFCMFSTTQLDEICEMIKRTVRNISNPDGSSVLCDDDRWDGAYHWFVVRWWEVTHEED